MWLNFSYGGAICSLDNTSYFEKHTGTVPESEITAAKIYRADFLSRYSEKDMREEDI
jgi:hypothetical protein